MFLLITSISRLLNNVEVETLLNIMVFTTNSWDICQHELNSFAVIHSVHPYCTRKFTSHVTHEHGRQVIK